MDGRAFLDVAGRLIRGTEQADWRTAAGRTYYGLMQEGLAALTRWGFAVPRRDQVHAFVRLRFAYAAEPDLKSLGNVLDVLGRLRNQADYQLATPGPFVDATVVRGRLQEARDALALLDAIEADPVRRTAAVAAVRAAFP